MAAALPIISIAPYFSPTAAAAEREAVSQALHTACRDYGFFYLDISCFVGESETDELSRLARQFFFLPQEEKDRISIKHGDLARGYQSMGQNVTMGMSDNHEGIDMYAPTPKPSMDPKKPLGGVNPWPEVEGFQAAFEKWIEKMKTLGAVTMQAMAAGIQATPEESKQLQSMFSDPFWYFRIIGYPPLPKDHDGFSCGAHKDYGCLTFLWADPTPSALQVFLRPNPNIDFDAIAQSAAAVSASASTPTSAADHHAEEGGERGVWINADPIPGCLVCNIGEMWEVLSGGMYKSTLHRVVHRSSNYRVSVPFFFEPNFDSIIKTLPAARRLHLAERRNAATTTNGTKNPGAGAESELREYEPVVYGDFLLNKIASNFDIENGIAD